MNAARKKKCLTLVLILIILGAVMALVLYALRQNISLFYSPTEVTQGKAPINHPIRVGGMVVKGSIKRSQKELSVHFDVTDYSNTIEVIYKGILPDLFREEQGIVAQGKICENGRFYAAEVLAKHDENYMPPEVRGMSQKKA